MSLPAARSPDSTPSTTSFRNFSYPIAVARYLPVQHFAPLPLHPHDFSLLSPPFAEEEKPRTQRRSHLFYWTPPDPPAANTGVGYRDLRQEQTALKSRRRSILQGLTWSSTLFGSPAMGGGDQDQPADAIEEKASLLSSRLALPAASSTTTVSTSSSSSSNHKPTKWLSHFVGWLGTSEPSITSWKDHQSELFRRCEVSKDDSAQKRSMKVHAPGGELPPEAPAPTSRE